MPEYLAPGVYVEEVEKGAKPIEGVSTSTAGFLGLTERGRTEPQLVTSFADFERKFGGFALYEEGKPLATTYLAYAVEGFFRNGGQRCYVGRITPEAEQTTRGSLRDGESGVLAAMTGDIEFGTVVTEGSTSETFTLANRGSGRDPAIVVTDVDTEPDGVTREGEFTVEAETPLTLLPGDRATVTATFAPEAAGNAGAKGATLVATYELEGDEHEVELTELTGTRADLTVFGTDPEAAELSFGSVPEGTTRRGTLTLRNPSEEATGAETVVRNARSGSDEFEVLTELPDRLELDPGDDVQVAVEFDPAAPDDPNDPDADALRESTLTVAYGKTVTTTAALSGTRRELHVEDLDAGAVPVGESDDFPVELRNESPTATVEVTAAALGDANVGFSVPDLGADPIVIGPGGTAELTVTFGSNADAAPGDRGTDVTLQYTVDPDGDGQDRSLQFDVSGEVSARLRAAPAPLEVGAVVGGGVISNTIELTNVGAADDVSVQGVAFNQPGFRLEHDFGAGALDVPAGESQEVTVFFEPPIGADPVVERTMSLTYDVAAVGDLQDEEFTVVLRGETVDLDVESALIDPDDPTEGVDFGSVVVDGVETATVTLGNPSDSSPEPDRATITVTDISLPDDVESFSVTSQFTPDRPTIDLPPGESTTAEVAFSPTDVAGDDGEVSTLTVSYTVGDAPAGRQRQVPVRGAGAPAALRVDAVGPGPWGRNVAIVVENASLFKAGPNQQLFKLTIRYWADDEDAALARALGVDHDRVSDPTVEEVYDNLSPLESSSNYYKKAINNVSALVDVERTGEDRPANSDGTPTWLNATIDPGLQVDLGDYRGQTEPGQRTGLAAFEEIDDISIVCIPDENDTPSVPEGALTGELVDHCERLGDRFAVLQARQNPGDLSRLEPPRDTQYGAFYYPWIRVMNPATNVKTLVPPGGYVAGIYARSDTQRGVHKAPANETVRGALELQVDTTKGEQDVLNPKGVNCIRSFPGRGIRVWGARTASSDPLWKYVNVRRLFLYLEESIDENTQWVVFEPNDERLWARVRQTVSNFLTATWRDGALMGTTPEEAFYVKCDRTTMTDNDIASGKLIVEVGVAPVRPAEFVIFRIAQLTASAQEA